MEKVDVIVTKECPLILDSTQSPSCFGTMEIEKGGYVEIHASMDITIDTLKRAEAGAQTDRTPPRTELRENPTYDFYITGRKGKSGEDGPDGQDGKSEGCHGCPGQPGFPGAPGDDGPTLTIRIAQLLDDFSLVNLGGHGGRGGRGGDGGNGADYNGGVGGNGGDGGCGGNGGNGGDGGNVTIYYDSTNGSSIRCANKKSEGGAGGQAGRAGQGGSPKGGTGKRGEAGTLGLKGQIGSVQVNPPDIPKSLMDRICQGAERTEQRFREEDPAHWKALLDRLGGEDFLKRKYPAVYRGLLVGRRERLSNSEEDLKKDQLNVNPPGFCQLDLASANQLTEYLVSDVSGIFPEGMEYVFVSGILKDDHGAIQSSFADEFEASDITLITETQNSLDAYMNDIFKMNDVEYHSEGECYAVSQSGAIFSSARTIGQGVMVDGSKSIVKKLTVTAPVHTNSQQSDKIIVLYNREEKSEEKHTWDYKYPDNEQKNNKVNTLLKYSGRIEMTDNYTIIGYGAGGYQLQLEYQGLDEPTATYNRPESEVAGFFQISDDQKSCTFTFDEDWLCKLDVRDYNASCVQKLRSYFWILVHREDWKEDMNRLIAITIYSTTDPRMPLFEAEGTTVGIPEISIRWGCFHEATRIRMADGTRMPVGELESGMPVATADGGSAKILEVYSGPEPELVFVETENGHQIQVSKGHPLYTPEGGIRAEEVRPGDRLLMEDGSVQPVRFAYLVPYGGKVYNMELEGGEQRIFADGFVAGDFLAQNNIKPAGRTAPRTEAAQETVTQLKALLRELGAVK